MKIIFKICTLSLILFFSKVSISFSDVDITKYPLGISPKTIEEKLREDDFVFQKFTEEEIVALKKIALVERRNNIEFSEVITSTKLKAKVCAGKVYSITLESVFGGNLNALLLGRKSFYNYLVLNEAEYVSSSLHKNDINPTVVHQFNIDRNEQNNSSVRGNEELKVGLLYSKELKDSSTNEPFLQMRFELKNKWFCPS